MTYVALGACNFGYSVWLIRSSASPSVSKDLLIITDYVRRRFARFKLSTELL